MPLLARTAAVQATINRFIEKPFVWGSEDCAHLVAFHLQALGYPNPLAKVQPYATRRRALQAMKNAGITDMATHLEQTLGFERIPPAMALPGDIIGLTASEEDTAKGWVTLGINVGLDRVLTFADGVCAWAPSNELGTYLSHAWRVPPAKAEAV